MKTFLMILLASCAAFAKVPDEVKILVDGQLHKTLKLDEIRKMYPQQVEYFNPKTKQVETYKGVPTLALLESIVGTTEHKMVELELNSTDLYSAYISKEHLDKTMSILAYERVDKAPFTRLSNRLKVQVPLGPLYMVWDLKSMRPEERLAFPGVYQIISINVLTSKVDLGGKFPDVDPAIALGHEAYKRNCIACHALGGHGGGISFNLLERKTLSSKGAEYVKKYILNPKAMNPKTGMLPLPQFKNREQVADGIIEFLRFMENPDELLNKKKAAADGKGYQALIKFVKEAKTPMIRER